MLNLKVNNKELIMSSLVSTTTQGFSQCNGWDKDPYQRNLFFKNSYPLNS